VLLLSFPSLSSDCAVSTYELERSTSNAPTRILLTPHTTHDGRYIQGTDHAVIVSACKRILDSSYLLLTAHDDTRGWQEQRTEYAVQERHSLPSHRTTRLAEKQRRIQRLIKPTFSTYTHISCLYSFVLSTLSPLDTKEMAFVTRKGRDAPAIRHYKTPNKVGPGSYDVTTYSNVARSKPSFAPFASTSKRAPINNEDAIHMPGPGEYAQVRTSSHTHTRTHTTNPNRVSVAQA